jgi:sugar/nucleoside kinase (ribokinase family)
MTTRATVDAIAIGHIVRQTISPINHKPVEHILGGPALYAASGMRSCLDHVGIVSTIPSADQAELARLLEKYQVNNSEIGISSSDQIYTEFLGYSSAYAPVSKQPIPFFSALGKPLPPSLRDGNSETESMNLSGKYYPSTLSPIYLDTSAAHICSAPLDHQMKVNTLLNKASISVSTILSNPEYMVPSQWELVMTLMNGLTAFITTPSDLQSLFQNRSMDIVEISEILISHGCMYLVLIKGCEGYELHDLQRKEVLNIPIYPSEIIDPTGMDEVFCGGFISELRLSHNPIKAVIRGSVCASIKGEGCGPFFLLESTPGLVEARMDRIAGWVKTNKR